MVHGRLEAAVDIESLPTDFYSRFQTELASLLGFPEGRPTTTDGVYGRIAIEETFSGINSVIVAFSIAPLVDVDLHCENGQSGTSFMQPVPGRYLLLTDDPVHWQCLTVEDLRAMAENYVVHLDPYTGTPEAPALLLRIFASLTEAMVRQAATFLLKNGQRWHGCWLEIRSTTALTDSQMVGCRLK